MEITVQKDRLLIIRRRQSRRVWCQKCRREVDVIAVQEAASFAGAEQLALPGNLESEAWHVCAGKDGETLICLESLLKAGQGNYLDGQIEARTESRPYLEGDL